LFENNPKEEYSKSVVSPLNLPITPPIETFAIALEPE
jgi:hypothetical protein